MSFGINHFNNMKMPKISIIIATFNAAKTLRTALDSVCSLQMKDWECVIVDGVSRDDTVEIIREYVDADSRFRYVSEPDKGIYDAFNKGWKMARGEWIYYLGGDDKLTPYGIPDLLANECPDIDLLGGSVFLLWPNGRQKKQLSRGYRGCHQAYLTRRTTIQQVGGFDMSCKIIADFEMLTKLAVSKKYKAANYDIPIAYFFVGGESQKLGSVFKVCKERYLILRKYHLYKFPLLHVSYSFFRTISVRMVHKVLYKNK